MLYAIRCGPRLSGEAQPVCQTLVGQAGRRPLRNGSRALKSAADRGTPASSGLRRERRGSAAGVALAEAVRVLIEHRKPLVQRGGRIQSRRRASVLLTVRRGAAVDAVVPLSTAVHEQCELVFVLLVEKRSSADNPRFSARSRDVFGPFSRLRASADFRRSWSPCFNRSHRSEAAREAVQEPGNGAVGAPSRE
jgi:hypothetical protein